MHLMIRRASICAIFAIAVPTLATPTNDDLISADLYERHAQETSGRSADEIRAMNEAVLASLPWRSSGLLTSHDTRNGRALALDTEQARRLIRSIDEHPVVSYYSDRKYQQKDVEIGFCFGRATYAHLALLRMGLSRDSIKKAWLVGPMVAASVNWGFHVATIARVDSGDWMVIDNHQRRLMSLRDWYESFLPMNEQKNLRLYVTEPEKFSISLGKYDRIQLGLDLSRESDWYRNYFVDLMNWFGSPGSTSFFEANGLRVTEKGKVSNGPEVAGVSPGAVRSCRDVRYLFGSG